MAILISIRPEWLEKILNGEKTIEIRKTKPKCELPCKVYIYCTKGSYSKNKQDILCYYNNTNKYELFNKKQYEKEFCFDVNGKVVAEFILNEVTDLRKMHHLKATGLILYKGAMDMAQYHEYGGRYAWHISNLKIYDKPKELSEFRKICDVGPIVLCSNCRKCKYGLFTRPPQSYCYCEELEDKDDKNKRRTI